MNRKIGNISVPAIGLGCMGMSEFYGTTDDDQSLKVMDKSFDLGYRHFDTADMYGSGHNENLVGRFLKNLGGRAKEAFIATKAGIRRDPDGKFAIRVDSSPAYLKTACEMSLRRLGVESIDLYYLHRKSPEIPIEDSMQGMVDLLKEGKIKAIGLSEVSEHTLTRASAIHPIAALQSEYSLWSRDAEKGILDACEKLGVAFVAYSPLGRGFLSGDLSLQKLHESPGDIRNKLPRFQAENFSKNYELVEILKKMAGELNATPAQIALAWVLGQRDFIVSIPGTRKERHLSPNFESMRLELGPSRMRELSAAFTKESIKGERLTAELLRSVNL